MTKRGVVRPSAFDLGHSFVIGHWWVIRHSPTRRPPTADFWKRCRGDADLDTVFGPRVAGQSSRRTLVIRTPSLRKGKKPPPKSNQFTERFSVRPSWSGSKSHVNMALSRLPAGGSSGMFDSTM